MSSSYNVVAEVVGGSIFSIVHVCSLYFVGISIAVCFLTKLITHLNLYYIL